MKYVLIFRKMIIDDVVYYQGFSKGIGEVVEDGKIKIIDGNEKGKIISSIESGESLIYLETNQINYDQIGNEKVYIKLDEDGYAGVEDFEEEASVAVCFYNTFHDFSLTPDFDIQEIVLKTKEKIEKKLLGEEIPIKKILTKIYNNQMYFTGDFSINEMRKNKSNILLIGPIGCGKTTIKEELMESLNPLPVVECKLTGNFNVDVAEIINKLIHKTDGNKFLAERGIVIYDGISNMTAMDGDLESGKVIFYMDTLKQLMESKIIYFPKKDGKTGSFDLSLITFISMVDMDYDFGPDLGNPNEIKDYINYTRIEDSKLLEMGFSYDMLCNCFDDEIIFMNEITKELAIKILKNENLSPIYKLKKIRKKHGKDLEIKDNFIEELVEYGLNLGEGFEGILRVFKYLIESKGIAPKKIILDGDEIHDIHVGSIINTDEEEEVIINNKENNNLNNELDDLNVDIVKRTINGLTIDDTVNLIKKTVKGQDMAIFSVVNSFYNHIFNRYRGYSKEELRELKENVLLFGSTGVGKTAIVRSLANLFTLPYVREIATRYSKVGFVGEDVDSMLYDLVDAAGGNVKKAQNGILYVDEIDKIKSGTSDGNVDGMAQGVQYNLLTLIEGDIRRIEGRAGKSSLEFDTSNLWIVGTGAFDGIENFTKLRLKKEKGLGKIGFGESIKITKKLPTPTDDDLAAYGIDRQFSGRFPNKVSLNDMDVDTLYNIINNSEGGYINLVKKGYLSDGIILSMSEEFKKNLAKKALEKKQGARGIHSAFMTIKETIDKNVMNGDIGEVILNEDCIDNLENIQYVKKIK